MATLFRFKKAIVNLTLPIIMSLFTLSVNAQTFNYEKEKATDMFEFDQYGDLSKMKKTFSNGVILSYNFNEEDNWIVAEYVLKQIKLYLVQPFNSTEDGKPCRKLYSYYNQLAYKAIQSDPDRYEWYSKLQKINDWYKEFVNGVDVAPSFCDEAVFGFREIEKAYFTLNNKIEILFGWHGSSVTYPNGEVYGDDRINKTFENFHLTYTDSGNQACIYYNNGTVFRGKLKFNIEPFNDSINSILKEAYGDDVWNYGLAHLNYPFPYHPCRETFTPYNGKLLDSQDKIIDIYVDGQKLDDFDKMSVIAAEQGKIDREKKAIADAIAQKESIYKYYGSTYADAFYAGDIIIGMPEDLFLNGVKGHVFKKFWMANPSIISGNDTCYDLYKFDIANPTFEQIGYLWVCVKNGKRVITSIVYY